MYSSFSLFFLGFLTAANFSPRAEDLSVNVCVVAAIERGPLILKVSLVNLGQTRRHFLQTFNSPNVSLDVPASWRRIVRLRFFYGMGEGVRELGPGETWSETLYLHHRYGNISSGERPEGNVESSASREAFPGGCVSQHDNEGSSPESQRGESGSLVYSAEQGDRPRKHHHGSPPTGRSHTRESSIASGTRSTRS